MEYHLCREETKEIRDITPDGNFHLSAAR